VDAREFLRHGEGVVPLNYAKLLESSGSTLGNRHTRERMRQSFYLRIVFERDMRVLICRDEHKNEGGCDSGRVNFVRSPVRVPVDRRIKDDEMTL